METLIYFLRQIKYNRKGGASWSQVIHYFRWKAALEAGATSMRERMPWISFPAIDYLKRTLKRTDRVFEYGGGGSTLFWSERVAEVVTVEHDEQWFLSLEKHMKTIHGAQWTGNKLPAAAGELVPHPDPADPAHYASSDANYTGKNFKAYATAIDTYPDGYFDVVMVDGRARTSCLVHGLPKLKSGGLLILDNAERAHYTAKNTALLAPLEVVVCGMAPVIFNRDFSETRIYRKR